jgi:hypothetical protein
MKPEGEAKQPAGNNVSSSKLQDKVASGLGLDSVRLHATWTPETRVAHVAAAGLFRTQSIFLIDFDEVPHDFDIA